LTKEPRNNLANGLDFFLTAVYVYINSRFKRIRDEHEPKARKDLDERVDARP
jgi:hypothetical protein